MEKRTTTNMAWNRCALLFLSILLINTAAQAQNYALNFDGTDEYVSVPHDNALNLVDGDFTIEAWVFPTASGNKTVLSKGSGNGGGNNDVYIFQIQNNRMAIEFASATQVSEWGLANTNIPLNQWSHVAVTFANTGNSVSFYLNGTPDGTHTFTIDPYTQNDAVSMYIGRQGTECSCNYWQGLMSEIRIWNIERSPTNIQNNYQRAWIDPSLEPNLIAYYTFNNGTGNTLSDLTTFARHGTLINMESQTDWVAGMDYSLDFDGNDYVDLADYEETNDDFTLEAWIYLDNYSDYRPIISKNTPSSPNNNTADFNFQVQNNGNLMLFLGDNVSLAQGGNSSAADITVNTWTHVAATVEGTTIKVFINGALSGTGSFTGVRQNTTGPVQIGRFSNGSVQHWEGNLDEVRIWSEARSDAQIAAFYAERLNGTEPNLLTYFTFQEGSGSSLVNTTGGTNGTIQGNPVWVTEAPDVADASTLDVTNPSVSISTTALDPTILSPFQITITFSEEVTNFTVADLTVINGTASNLQTSDGIVFTADITPASVGVVTVSIAADVLTDLTGNGNTASNSLSRTYEGNNALDFDGAEDHIPLPTGVSVSQLNTFTVEAWVNMDAGVHGTIYSEGLIGNDNPMLSLSPNPANSGKLEVVLRDGAASGLVITPSNGALTIGSWTHVAFVRTSATTAKLYINGVETDSWTFTAPAAWTPNTVNVAVRRRSSYDGFFNGKIDELRIWNTARSQAEIQEALFSPISNTSGLVAYYRFDQTSGTTLPDLSSNGYDGTLTNMSGSEWIASGAFKPFAYQATAASVNGFTANWLPIANASAAVIDIGDDVNFTSPIATGIAVSDPAAGLFAVTQNLGSYANAQLYYRLRFEDGSFVSPYSGPVAFMVTPGNALALDGVNDYVVVASDPSTQLQTGTWETWVKLDTKATTQRIFFKSNASDVGIYELFYNAGSDQFGAEVVVGTIRYSIFSTTQPTVGIWYHVAGSYDGEELKIYVNGVEEGVNTAPSGDIDTNTGALGIGANPSGTVSLFLDGELDETRIWTSVRTASEIQNNRFTTLTGAEAGLVAYYRFDETSGLTLPDLSGNGNAGTLTGMAGTEWEASGAMQSATAPVAPTNLIAYRSSATDVTLEWSDNANDEAGYIIEQASDFGFTSGVTQVASIAANSTSYVHNIGTNQSVFYRVSATNGAGNGASAVEFATTSPHPGYALTFNGTNQHVEIPGNASLNFTSDFTAEAWIKLTGSSGYRAIASQWGTAGNTRWEFLVMDATNAIRFHLSADGTSDFNITTTTGLETDRWYHVGVVYDAGVSAKIFIDNVEQQVTPSGTLPGALYSNAALSTFIGRSLHGVNYFSGSIDELKIS